MSSPISTLYIDSQSRVIRCNIRLKSFVQASIDYNNDRTNVGKRAKINKMLSELNEMRRIVEDNIQKMESAVSSNTAPADIIDNIPSQKLVDTFDSLYYELAAFAEVHKFSLSPHVDVTTHSFANQSNSINNLTTFQLPKRKFPTFSGIITEWQGFEDLFKSILSHAPDLPDVERFEYLKTSLKGEALSLISHLSLTSSNYHSAWELLRTRYGNKRDLSRIHIDALLSTISVKSNDASSIRTQINIILEHTAALDNLDFTTRQWSPILIHIMEKHLDYDLRSRWELIVGDNHYPQLIEFVEFLRSHLRSAEVYSNCSTSSDNSRYHKTSSHNNTSTVKPRSTVYSKVLTANMNTSSIQNCVLCHKSHSIRKCPGFTEKAPQERFRFAKDHRLCINCLGIGHSSVSCPSKYKCQTCNRSHHSLLHFDQSSTSLPVVDPSVPSTSSAIPRISSLIVRQSQKVILLFTAVLDICATDGRSYTFRALLDSGSQASFITEKTACQLMLHRQHSPVHVSTFGSNDLVPIRGKSRIEIKPYGKQNPSFFVNTHIVPQITGPTPQMSSAPGNWAHIKDLHLADPSYHSSGPIDLLLGADILPSIFLDGVRRGKPNEPIAFETNLGWVLMGSTDSIDYSIRKSLCVSVFDTLDATLKLFWELEELPAVHRLSPDDTLAEELYKNTTTRLSNGRFVVTIPFKTNRPLLGNSRVIALQRYKSLETRLNQNQSLRQQYVDFMHDYLKSGHMELVPLTEKNNPFHYYIPHHCVLRPDSSTTKLRVVFNASTHTLAGMSLNESMYTGPKLQPDIQVVLLRARLWKYLFMADIKQMYRQILIQSADRDYLRILWRFTPESDIEEYRLCTVTYGTSAAPYQALRTIRELANTDGVSWPLAASVLLHDTFVDDILTGANCVTDALKCQEQLLKLCALAKFELRKWVSNSREVLEAVPEDARAMSPSILLKPNDQSDLKVLGLRWNPLADTFSFKTQLSTKIPTKRSVLSDIARVFDPLGLLSPITFWTKYVMQRLWTSGIKWDDPVSPEIAVLWKRYQSELHIIENIIIPRRLTYDHYVSLQLHAFSDSSEKGYAAAVYLRVETSMSIHCNLITGKSKVSPLKRSTIPRLELCGAVLAAKLLKSVVNTYTDRLVINEQHAWTDSTTALVWIRSSPHRWSTFIANRTSQIQECTPPAIWRHVPTQYNPVDCASRGLFPTELVNHPLWWCGPPFLLESSDKWPIFSTDSSENIDKFPHCEARKVNVLVVSTENTILNLLDHFSSLNKILRVIAYCRRMFKERSSHTFTKIISAEEVAHALTVLVASVQKSTYSEDIERIKKGLRCSKPLLPLDIFIDNVGLVRVGGRLNNADLPYAHKHPILLPSNHRLTELIIDQYHNRLKHPGTTTLQTQLQREFWIQSSRRVIRSRLRLCVSCFRIRPRALQPKMAPLPKYRVQQFKPFAITGVDYAGPITVKERRGRNGKSTSAYICLFVCFATKALHLELSSDLSTETFLLAFARFSARRGPIKEMHSDCGTNFIGASRLLTPIHELTHSQAFQDRVKRQLATDQITWCFNPPSAPHFGGLWEAGVKSTKTLILRSIGAHKVTSEELITLLTQIEATLNARPLCALSNDPADFEALTPSHFLTLEPSTSLPEPSLTTVSLSKLQRWRLISDLHRNFWTRWKNEYLTNLQLRKKWLTDDKQLQVDDLVLIKEATHPLHWHLGRVRVLHPGSDGTVRVVTLDTPTGSLIRPVVKLCPLPTP